MLRWPIDALGYGYGPRFKPEVQCSTASWVGALRAVFPGVLIELLRTAPQDETLPDLPHIKQSQGVARYAWNVDGDQDA